MERPEGLREPAQATSSTSLTRPERRRRSLRSRKSRLLSTSLRPRSSLAFDKARCTENKRDAGQGNGLYRLVDQAPPPPPPRRTGPSTSEPRRACLWRKGTEAQDGSRIGVPE